jgi:hypothetical protein
MISANISKKLEKGVGFSNGCALLALKNPPPLVPSCLSQFEMQQDQVE